MIRDIDRDDRENPPPPQAEPAADRSLDRSALAQDPRQRQEHELFKVRGSTYRLSASELETMHDIGRFRTIETADLTRHRYGGDGPQMQRALNGLADQGLIQFRTVWTGPARRPLNVVTLTRLGRRAVEQHGPRQPGQALYAGVVKPKEVGHDAAIYRMFQAERRAIERAGGHVRRLVLDYELKKRVYSPLAKVRGLPPADYARRQEDVARQNHLTVVAGKIPLPDLRIEYVTAAGEIARVDLELATGHYHGPAMQAKAEAGFKFYAADSSARLSRVLEERDITVAILSL